MIILSVVDKIGEVVYSYSAILAKKLAGSELPSAIICLLAGTADGDSTYLFFKVHMKPQDLKPPFAWKDRRVILSKGILFIPDYYHDYEAFQFPGWEDPSLFGNAKPIKIEFCSGNGDWIANRALVEPQSNWVAVEKRFDRSRKIWSKASNANLENFFIICGEALKTAHYYIPTSSVAEVFINFPDPWPKNRHAKHRLISEVFVIQLQRILEKGGLVTVATDDGDYTKQIIAQFLKNSAFEPQYPDPFFTVLYPDYGTSYFDQLWRSRGLMIHYVQFAKK